MQAWVAFLFLPYLPSYNDDRWWLRVRHLGFLASTRAQLYKGIPPFRSRSGGVWLSCRA
jgi:hypothetical protein